MSRLFPARGRDPLGAVCVAAALATAIATAADSAPGALPAPFAPDGHTVLLYHFDEGQGSTVHDAGRFGYDGQVRGGATWVAGRFGQALRLNGRDGCVFRELTPALSGMSCLTVECWFLQDDPAGRQFLAGKDVTFHYDLSDGVATSLSIYNQGGGVKNAEGLQHQHLGCGTGRLRPGRWHHNAVTYDGRCISFFVDGVLQSRLAAAKDFRLGREELGFWAGCYVGRDFWFSGRIDELRLSDCVRYDPATALKPGGRAFEVAAPRPALVPCVRTPQRTGLAQLRMALQKVDGDTAAGWVYLKAPATKAVIVGRYDLKQTPQDTVSEASFDVSDEASAPGAYVLGLEPTDMTAAVQITRATIEMDGRALAAWTGVLRSRRTFRPPLLVPLNPPNAPAERPFDRLVLAPAAVDRLGGTMAVEADEEGGQRLTGEGFAEFWLRVPARQAYRVSVRYAAAGRWASDIVVDGRDLHPYLMGTRNKPLGPNPQDALWEQQGTVALDPGVHWLRLQDMPPDIYGIRLDALAEEPAPPATPWERYDTPEASFLGGAGRWRPEVQFGRPQEAVLSARRTPRGNELGFAVRFAGTDVRDLDAGDGVRLVRRGTWDLEPFGRLRFGFHGTGSGHVVALWLLDVKGDEKLLWRQRDDRADVQPVSVAISFEGNDVFDPAHVVAVAVELDEGNVRPEQVNAWSGALVEPVFERRDELAPEADLEAWQAAARRSLDLARRDLPANPPSWTAPRHRPWTIPVAPETHPLFAVAEPKPVTRQTLGYGLHMTGARDIAPATLDLFHRQYVFGDVCWPHLGILPQRARYPGEAEYQQALRDLEARLCGVRDRGLCLFDLWGYVPFDANYPARVAPEHHEILMRVFGERFLGYDNGEQDGRYIGAYASRGKAATRREGWDDFVAWDEHVCAESMNYMNATGSLNFSHYYGERQARMLGLETAQGLPSDTLMFAFLRGASRQYGRLTYQASSVWNRYGYNVYADRRSESSRGDGYGLGPAKGASLSLHRRLFFCGWLDGHSIFGTETSQFTADTLDDGRRELSPLGQQHLDLKQWNEQHPDRGVAYTPIAFVLDFYNGWNPPRHLYRGDTCRIWGKFPYERGDTLIDAMFRLVWPGYEDCSYRRNERGFITPTPYGDLFDVLTNRCLPEVLRQYPALVLLGDVEMTPEFVARLCEYVQAGGDLVLEARLARALPESLSGVTVGPDGQRGCLTHWLPVNQTFAEPPYRFTTVLPLSAAPLLVSESGAALITLNRAGRGRVIVGAVDAWLTEPLTYRHPELVGIALPSTLLAGVQAVLGAYFESFNPVQVEPVGLTVKTCFFAESADRMLVGLINNELSADWEGDVRLRTGSARSVRELWRGADLRPGRSLHLRIPAGDVAILDLRLSAARPSD